MNKVACMIALTLIIFCFIRNRMIFYSNRLIELLLILFQNELCSLSSLLFRSIFWYILGVNGIGGINAGWWRCINKNGRRGIVPANRLRMLHRFDRDNSPQVSKREYYFNKLIFPSLFLTY